MPNTIQPRDSDHTALVHALWDAHRKGVTIQDFDELASFIMRSDWLQAVRQHATDPLPRGSRSPTC